MSAGIKRSPQQNYEKGIQNRALIIADDWQLELGVVLQPLLHAIMAMRQKLLHVQQRCLHTLLAADLKSFTQEPLNKLQAATQIRKKKGFQAAKQNAKADLTGLIEAGGPSAHSSVMSESQWNFGSLLDSGGDLAEVAGLEL